MYIKCTYSDWWNLWLYRAPYRGTAFTEHFVARDPEAVWSWIRDLLFGVWSKWKSSGLCLQGTCKYINDVHNFMYLNLMKTDVVQLLTISYYSFTGERPVNFYKGRLKNSLSIFWKSIQPIKQKIVWKHRLCRLKFDEIKSCRKVGPQSWGWGLNISEKNLLINTKTAKGAWCLL